MDTVDVNSKHNNIIYDMLLSLNIFEALHAREFCPEANHCAVRGSGVTVSISGAL